MKELNFFEQTIRKKVEDELIKEIKEAKDSFSSLAGDLLTIEFYGYDRGSSAFREMLTKLEDKYPKWREKLIEKRMQKEVREIYKSFKGLDYIFNHHFN